MEKIKISKDSVTARIKDIVASDIDDEKVMMNIEKGEYYGLDPVGSRIWEMIENPVKVSNLIAELMLQYNVDYETCEKDTIAFLEQLFNKGVLQVKG